MGSLVLADLLTEVLAGLGNRNDPGVSDSALVAALNLAQQRVQRRWPWKDLRRLQLAQMSFTGNTAVDKYLALPANLKILHSFVLLDTSGGMASLGLSGKVSLRPWRWFDQRYPSPEWLPPGWPQVAARWNTFLVMVPAPIAQFTAQLRTTIYPTPFNTNNMSMASDFVDKDDILINWALGYKHRSYGRLDRATYHENLVEALVNEAIEQDDREPDLDISRDVGGVAGGVNIPYWSNFLIDSQP